MQPAQRLLTVPGYCQPRGGYTLVQLLGSKDRENLKGRRRALGQEITPSAAPGTKEAHTAAARVQGQRDIGRRS